MRTLPGVPAQPTDLCRWFALCDRPAIARRPHPILGSVPICGPCDDKIGQLEQATR